MPPINASVTNQQITASVGETQIDVTVTGGVGPTGPQGPAGVSYTLPNATTSTLGGVIVGSGLSVSSGTVSANVTSVAGRTGAVTIAAADVSGLGSLATQSSLAYSSLTGKPTTLSGYGITDAVGSSDSRLTNSREWSASTASQSEAETGTSTSRLAFTPQRIFQAIAAWWAASSSKTKLDGIATGATANSSDATLLSRANHTGTQSAGTITGLATVATSGAYSDLSGRPTLDFAASSHSHEISSVNGLQTALDGKQATGSYATLVGGTVPSSQLPSYVDDVLEFASVGNFPATGESGKIFVATSSGKVYRWSGSAYVEISPSPGSTDSVPEGSVNLYHTTARAAAAAPVQTVSGKTGSVILSSSDVGLGNVDNTSDVNKPISTATQTAINGKASASHAHGNLTNAGAIGTTSGQIVVTTTGGVVTAASSISSSAVSGLATVATSGSYADLSNKPATFTPSSHTHTASAITDFSSAVDAKLTTQTANVSFAGITMYDGPGSGGGMFIGYQQILGIASLSFNSGGTQTTAWTGSIAISGVTGLQAALDGKQASGNYATLVGGTVPSSQLPSYVDDVLEFASVGAFPATGESGKIFVATGTGKIYRWSGSTYIEISPSPGSTDSISEGSVNLYHTTARAAAAAPVQSVAGRTGAVTIAAADVSGLGSLATQSSVSYSALTDKPATFAPSSHTHTASAITDFDSAVASASPAEVLEYTTSASFPATGSTGKIYVATDSSRAYRWTGAAYAEVGPAGAYLPTHTHAASDIVSGTLASARLPSATTSTAGAVTVGTGLAVSSGTISAEVIGRYLPGYDGIADADDWASRVATAGGSVSTDTMTAVYKFCISIAAAGVRDRFYRLNLFCGSNLTTALVPLYRGLSRSGTQYGNTTDTNYNFLSGDYSESTGLIGNGSNKYLDTGFNVSTLTLASRHLSFYENQKATVQWSTPIGVTGTSYYFRYDWETASGATYGTYGAYLDSSAASSCKDAYYAQAGAHFIATNTAALLWNMYKGGWDVKGVVYGLSNTTANPSATLTVFCNRNGASGTNQFWNGRLVAYSVGLGMTGAAAVAYSAALQEFNRSLGRAA